MRVNIGQKQPVKTGIFFNFINNKLSCKRGLGALNNDNGDLIIDDGDRANLLNDYFASMCTSDNGLIPDLDCVVPTNSNLENIEFTPDNIYAVIRKLMISGASGPDGFPPRLFKTLASCLSAPLSLCISDWTLSINDKKSVGVACISTNAQSTVFQLANLY